ncbi:trehalose-phosphatase [bacterium]|nr:trehalose-phosphatase [bacterium]
MPFADTPDLALPDAELIKLLERVGKSSRVNLHIVSGRTKETLDKWLGMLPIGLHAEHGFWSKSSRKETWQPLFFDESTWKNKVKPILERVSLKAPGSLVEEKTAGLAWHYRRVEPELGNRHARILIRRLQRVIVGLPVEILEGEKVVEVRRKGVHKGIVLSRLFQNEAIDGVAIVAIGDDQTDEDMFQALPPQGFSIHIGLGKTIAKHRLKDVRECRQFLQQLYNGLDTN